MNLYLVYLGGTTKGANIELHDVRFVVANSIEESYELLKAQWFGDIKGLHIDAYMQIKHVDGFDVSLQNTPQLRSEKLFFVNFGGYQPNNIAELHEFFLCCAKSEKEAKEKGKKQLLVNMACQHKDNLMELDDCLALEQLQGLYVHLTPSGNSQTMKPDWFGYQVIG